MAGVHLHALLGHLWAIVNSCCIPEVGPTGGGHFLIAFLGQLFSNLMLSGFLQLSQGQADTMIQASWRLQPYLAIRVG